MRVEATAFGGAMEGGGARKRVEATAFGGAMEGGITMFESS